MAAPTPISGYNDCPWPVDPACFAADWAALPAEVQDRSRALASSTLRRLSGYRVGGCSITVRPCKASCASGMPSYYDIAGGYGSSGFYPHINEAGMWVNSCGCSTDCGCSSLCEVELPGPVGEVYEVRVDGAVVPVADYRIDDNRLVWVGSGACPWPTCQDLSKPDTEVGTFSVQYLNSYPVDKSAQFAVATLAMEFARACTGNKCRLPASVTSITRQGVSMEIATGSFPNGVTGIREVDAWIALWNPNNLRQQTGVWSPDMRRTRIAGTAPIGGSGSYYGGSY